MPKPLVIVESPAKAKTIEKYLGKDYKVLASYGHVRDLPRSDFAVLIDGTSAALKYEVPKSSAKYVSAIRKEAKEAEQVFLATDLDRERFALLQELEDRLETPMLVLGFVWLGQNTPIELLDTHLGMILVYTAFFVPLAIWFMRAFFQAIPRELEEAALVDGCTRFGAFVRVVIPNAAPGLLATFVYAFLFAWDELLFATALTEHDAETIPIGIRNFIGNYQERTAQLMAAGVVSTLPVLIAFFATQRWLVKGITAGAVKGWWLEYQRFCSLSKLRSGKSTTQRKLNWSAGMVSLPLVLRTSAQ